MVFVNVSGLNVGNPSCPVHSFLKYLDKGNDDITSLWQRLLALFFPDSETWYCKAPLGKNTLGKMSEISRQGQLSKATPIILYAHDQQQ